MDVVELKVGGMSCGGCVGSVTRVLLALEGVTKVEVSLEKASASVEYDPVKLLPAQLQAAVRGAGFACD